MTEAEILFFTCYGAMTFWALMSCLYLLLRRNNVFATDITSSLRLRRWMAASCASVAVSHVWWMLLYYGQADGSDPAGRILLCRVLDVLFHLPVIFYTMLVMLQDRRRPLWYAVVYVALGLAMLLSEYLLGPQASWLSILLSVVMVLYVIITLVVGVRQYGRWLRDNYADLEHKEVWQTYLVVSAFLPSTFFYSFLNVDRVFDFLLEVVNIPLFFILLWRVETLQDLEESVEEPFEESVEEPFEESVEEPFEDGAAESADPSVSTTQFAKIELMLQQNCIDTQYYLQHDLSLTHLARHIGTNNTYLSRYFAYKGITYNTYINTLRIAHFMRLYQTTIKTRQYVTAAELSYESGYKSYSTFSVAFKQINGQTVKSWMKQQE